MPSTRSTMSTPDHRSPRGSGSPARWPRVAMASYLLPALAGLGLCCFRRSPAPIWPALRRSLGVEDRTASGCGYALTFDDGPHAAGHAGGARDPRRARACRRPSSWSASRCGATPRSRARSSRRPSDRPALRSPPQPAAPGAVAGARGHRPRAGDASRTATGCADGLYRPPYGVLNAVGAAHGSRAAAGGRCCGATGAATGRRAPRPTSIAARVTDGVSEGSVLLLHDADDYSAPGSWRRTVGGAAAGPGVLGRARSAACGALTRR